MEILGTLWNIPKSIVEADLSRGYSVGSARIRERKCVRASGRDRAYLRRSSFEDWIPYRSLYGSRVAVDNGVGRRGRARGVCSFMQAPVEEELSRSRGPLSTRDVRALYLRSPAPKVVTNLEREIPARRFRAESQRWRRVALATRGKRQGKAREKEREREMEDGTLDSVGVDE